MDTERIAAEALLGAFEPPLSPEALLRVEINLHLPDRNDEAALYIALRVGLERMYVVRSLPAFLRAVERGETLAFGKGFTYDPAQMRFERTDMRVLWALSEIEAAQRQPEAQGYKLPQNGKFMPLGERAALRMLRLLRARPFRLIVGGGAVPFDPIGQERLPMACALEEQGGVLWLKVEMPADVRPVTADFSFVHTGGRIIQLPTAQGKAARALYPWMRGGGASFRFGRGEAEQVVSELLPRLEEACGVALSDALAARVRREPLKAVAFVDREGERVVVRVEFRYGETAVDPFAKAAPQAADGTLLVRDIAGEHTVLEVLAQWGFHVGAGRAYLAGGRRALAFILEGVRALQKVAEVYASEAFQRMKPRRPRLTGRLGMAGGALEFAVLDGDVPVGELGELMRALRDRKKYFRLKDGGFLDLAGLSDWQDLAEALGDVADTAAPGEGMRLSKGRPVLALGAYRAVYLAGLLAESGLPVAVEEEAAAAARALTEAGDACPRELAGTLRPYQIRGFQWIQALHRLRMGGILADDMGLGKTLQTIAAIVWAKAREGSRPSLVVTPTSLIYNWQAEVNRFAPGLSTWVIEGSQNARAARWASLRQAEGDGPDVVVTSYPLLRRDIDLMEGLSFRFVVLDEAQHIKNPQSLAAVAAGRLEARARLALTGTPMENSVGELWSLFHFVLPGYLPALPQFLRRYGDGGGADSLRRRIRPFLLRRLKGDVLPELPEKIETRVLADMPPSQRAVYAASALALRERVERVLGDKGLGRGRMEVLSAITQLRQICCHPALVLDEYAGSSGKMDALMEILGEALAEGRRALLFSQFTSMLAILRRRLDGEGVRSIFLDGRTPGGQRLELVNRFNGGEGQVFLISLKAGGAGLNLTGADMVIHYDPWWNPAAEDQATDRAHRIGQQNVVQVIRLITRGTIEEQVARLSQRKRALFDLVVTAGEQMPSDLTEGEIMGLFA